MSVKIPTTKGGEGVQVAYLDNDLATVSVSGTSAQSAAFSAEVSVVRVVSTTDCHLLFGVNPTATTDNAFLPANSVEYFGVHPGEKVAVIQATASGTLYITEAG